MAFVAKELCICAYLWQALHLLFIQDSSNIETDPLDDFFGRSEPKQREDLSEGEEVEDLKPLEDPEEKPVNIDSDEKPVQSDSEEKPDSEGQPDEFISDDKAVHSNSEERQVYSDSEEEPVESNIETRPLTKLKKVCSLLVSIVHDYKEINEANANRLGNRYCVLLAYKIIKQS